MNDVKCYYINMAKRIDRKYHMKTMFKQRGFVGQRIEAVDGKAIDRKALLDNGVLKNEKLTNSEIGCLMSHRKVWKEFISNSNKKYCLQLEDDTMLTERFKYKLQTILNEVKDIDFDYMTLHIRDECIEGYPKIRTGKSVSKHVFIPKQLGSGGDCFLITKSGAKKLYDYHAVIKYAYDHFEAYRYDIELKTLAVKKNLARCVESGSVSKSDNSHSVDLGLK